jgi:hypothetical protein|tara:strand:- start:888 stop:1136 length:249 start_codon:yes stop_codon:yes gene_type:complete
MKLSSNEAVSLAELWDSVKPYVPVKDRNQAAQHFLSAIQDSALCDLEENANELHGVCSILDRALKEYSVADDVDEYAEESEY